LLLAVSSLGAAQLPLVFERNAGQARKDVRFLGRGGAEQIALLDGGSFRTHGVEIRLARGNPRAVAVGLEPLPGRSHYFIGNDAARWRTGVAQFRQVRYQDVYPGIDLVFHGREYDFVVTPQSDPARIQLEFGARVRRRLDSGDLVAGGLRQKRPRAYQVLGGKRQEVAADFVLAGRVARFRLGPYDRSLPLVIDPVIDFVSYLGGAAADFGRSVAVDAAGNIYVAGGTDSGDFPTPPGSPKAVIPSGRSMAFVTKLSPDGSTILYSTFLGGDGGSFASGIQVDAAGNAYVTGDAAANFPTTPGAYRNSPAWGFIAKLSPAGDWLVYSAVISSPPRAIAIDAAGSAYVTGIAEPTFASTPGAYQRSLAPGICPGIRPTQAYTPCFDSFVLKLRPDGSAPAYATFLGGTDNDATWAIAVAAAGNAIVTGDTESGDFPVTAGAIQSSFHGKIPLIPGSAYGDGFVTKLNANGSGLVYSTYLGGANRDAGMALALDGAGNAYVAGITESADFPTTPGVLHATFIGTPPIIPGSGGNGFVTKIDPGGRLVYSTFLLGYTGAIAVDGGGYVYLEATAPGPCASPAISILSPRADAMVDSGTSGVGLSGSSLLALDGKGFAYVAGNTESQVFFATPGSMQAQYGGASDAFVAKLVLSGNARTSVACAVNSATQWPGLISLAANGTVAPGEIFTIYGTALGPDTGVPAQINGGAVATALGGTRVLFDGIPAPLLWAQGSQINAVVPFAIQAPSTAMTIERNGVTYGPWKLPVAPAVPGIFTIDSSGNGQAAVFNQDGTLNSPSNPAHRGSVIVIYATGAGQMDPPMADGAIAPLALPLPKPRLGIAVRVGGFDTTVQYAGAAPGLVAGAIQVNALVPDGVPVGDAVSLVLYADGYGSGLPGYTFLAGRATVAIR
jgi:uncharacterized protein (TIGR03437 family)